MRKAIAVALLLATIPVGAASQTSTDCYRTAAGVTCDSSPSAAAGFAALANAIAAKRQQKQVSQRFIAALQSGDCDTASDLAAQYGNADDRRLVRQCAAEKATAPAPVQSPAEAERVWMTAITSAVAAGRCDEAKANALAGGRLDIADQVVRVCTPTAGK